MSGVHTRIRVLASVSASLVGAFGCAPSTTTTTTTPDAIAIAASQAPATDPAASQRSVDAGLAWLKRHQDPAGFWSCGSFSKRCAGDACDGTGQPQLDLGVTALATLAFLGAGDTHRSGAHQEVVARALTWLRGQQDADTGLFGPLNSHQAFLYEHALATLAVTEAYVLSKDDALLGSAKKGIEVVQASRNPFAAWRYAFPPNGDNDLSVTGWMVLALLSAKDAGIEVDARALEDAHRFIEGLTDESTWRTGYLTRGGYSAREPGTAERFPETRTEAMTALAMTCRMHLGEDPNTSEALKGGAARLVARLPNWDPKSGVTDFYYWYYGTFAMAQVGGASWDQWRNAIRTAATTGQRKGGDADGSWDPQVDPWGHRGGRVFTTAMLTIALQADARASRVVMADRVRPTK